MEEFEPLSRQTGIGKVHLLKASDREAGVRGLLGRFELDEYAGKRIALKANFNSADPFPASTHLDTLGAIVKVLKEVGAGEVVLAERSGMGDTRNVIEEMGVFDLSKELGFEVVVLDEVPKEDWAKIEGEGNHWLRGFYMAKVFLEADRVVQTCCLKTHRFGGHFTLSLKNSVGMVAKRVPGGLYNYMWELHGSPHQRKMIAEINQHYDCDLVVMDGLKAFVDQGPEKGELVEPGLLLASSDRVAIDAVGIAVLRKHGSTKNVMKRRIFELEQIARAAELGVGVKAASDIEVVPLDEGSRGAAEELRGILENQG